MKRYLLIIMMMVCAVTGAWATPTPFGTASTYEVSDGVLTLTIGAADDVANNSSTLDGLKSGVKRVKIVTTGSVILSGGNGGPLATLNALYSSSVSILDLSEAAVTYNTSWDGVTVSLGMADGSNNTFENFIVPSSYSSNPGDFKVSNMYNAGSIATTNNFTIESSTVVAGVINKADKAIGTNLTSFSSSATTLKILNEIETTDLTSVLSSEQILDLTNVTTTGNTSTNPITVASGVKVVCLSEGVAARVKGTSDVYNLDIKCTAAELQDKLDALSSAGFTPTSITITSASAPLTQDDLDRLNTAVERINLEDATFASGVTINNLTLHSSLKGLTLPKGSTIDPTLKASAASSNLEYIYVPTTETQTQAGQLSVADYVWVVRPGGLARAMKNEATLRTAVYVKVASEVALNNDDAKFGSAGIDASAENDYPWQYVDLSGTIVTVEATLAATAPHNKSYRIILPDNLTGDNMAIFASNPNHGNVAAVYSYNSTKLTIMEIVDDSYKPAALADPRIMRSTTTEVDVVSGYYNGNTYAQFGTHLLEALNNMGNSSYEYVPGHANTAGLNVRTISIKTTSAAPDALTFTNPLITTLKVEGLLQTSAALNVNACNALTTLSLKGSNLNSVTAQNTHITSADLSATAISTTTNFNGATALATFTTTNESVFNGDLDLTSSDLTTFNSSARFGGNLKLNASNKLTSVDVGEAIFTNNSSVIHVDNATDENESNTVISGLQGTDRITVPASFKDNVSNRVHPYVASYVKVAPAIADAYTATSTNMVFHDKETTEETPDKYRYWYYNETADADGIVTVGTTSTRTLHDVIKDHSVLTSATHAKIKVVGPLTQHSVDSLKYLNATTLDLSEATSGVSGTTIGQLLKTCFSNTSTLGVHSNVKFIQLPDTCSRDHILNATALDGLKNSVYCVLSINDTGQGKDLTSYSFVSGALQPAVIMADNNNSDSWQKKPDNETTAKLYSSSVSTFKKLKISGLINSYDLSRDNQKLDADGHLSWAEEPVETSSQTRTLNGGYVVYGPFSACHNLTEIDLRDAYFEKKGDNTGLDDYHKRYWFSDMTLSTLNVISTATYKVVVPQDSRVHEIPADFMNCPTKIRAICIPSNIQAIRTRAFYTIDYVWTTADAYATTTSTADPEGKNTRLDNGAKLSNGTAVSALLYEHGKYKENPAFLDSYYTADYSGDKGGGTYTFGSTLKLIETGAFANAQPHVKDVYVLNTKAPECHVDAFNTVMYTGNGGYSSISGDQKIISRENYFNNGFWITMLHYPRQTTTPELQRYTDPTREYSIATGERDGKGATLYFPNQSEFIRAYQQGTYGYIWNAWNPKRTYGSVDNGTLLSTTEGWTVSGQSTANELFNAYTSGTEDHKYTSFYKVNQTDVTNVPSAANRVEYYLVGWDGSSYSEVSAGSGLYPRSEIDSDTDSDNSGEKTSKDYRGWHQFVLNAYAANTILDEEPYRSYITDNDWWTICMPFSLTRAEAIQIFGTPAQAAVGDKPAVAEQLPYVSRLLYVIRNLNTANISLCFSKNLMTNSEGLGKLSSENNKQHGVLDGNGVVTIAEGTAPKAGDIVMAAGVPYLIKPNMPMSGSSAVNRQFRIYTTEAYAKLTTEQQNATSPRAICNDSLYARIKASQVLSGADQISLVEDGICKVPVFMPDGYDERVSTATERGDGEEYAIGDGEEKYQKSIDWFYAFVGTFFKSFMPQYSYYLGWNGKAAQFFYKTSAKENVMTWINETGVIVPTAGEPFDIHNHITPASGQVPAQWVITGSNDYFTIDNGDGTKQQAKGYGMLLDADNVTIVTGVETPEVAVPEVIADGNGAVYNISGQKVDASRNALPKGIYIQNGKKYVVK